MSGKRLPWETYTLRELGQMLSDDVDFLVRVSRRRTVDIALLVRHPQGDYQRTGSLHHSTLRAAVECGRLVCVAAGRGISYLEPADGKARTALVERALMDVLVNAGGPIEEEDLLSEAEIQRALLLLEAEARGIARVGLCRWVSYRTAGNRKAISE